VEFYKGHIIDQRPEYNPVAMEYFFSMCHKGGEELGSYI